MSSIRSISLKFWLPVFFAAGSALLVLGTFWSTYNRFESDLVDFSLAQVSRDLAALQRELIHESRQSSATELGDSEAALALALMGTDIRYRLLITIDKNGRVVHSTRFAHRGKLATEVISDSGLRRCLSASLAHQSRPEVIVSSDGHHINAHFPLTERPLVGELRGQNGGTLLAVFDMSSDQANIWNHAWHASLPIGLMSLVLSLMVFAVITHFSNRPLQHLANIVGAIGKGGTGEQTKVIGGGEIAQLAAGINTMSSQLDQRFEQRRRAEAALQTSEQHLTTTFNSIGDAVIATDEQALITRMNPVAEQLTGWQADAAIGRPVAEVFQIINGNNHEPAESPITKVLASGEITRLSDNTILRQAGSSLECQIADSAAPIRDTQGLVIGVVLVFRDVTQEYAIRQSLSESEKRSRLALSVANDGVWDWHIDRGQHTLLFDERFFTMAGYVANEFAHEVAQWQQRVHPDDLDNVNTAIRGYLAGQQQSYDVEFRFRRKDGDYMWIRGRGKVVERDTAGEPTRFVGTHTDISALKQTETILRRTQRMETVSQLTGGIAHDFNNILGIILGNLELVDRDSGFSDKSQRRLDAISTAANRAAELTQQLLGFSSDQQQGVVVCNINDLVVSMEVLMGRSLTPEIEIENKLLDELWSVEINPGEFQDALLNLIINARDGMDDQGLLTLETHNTVLDENYCKQHAGVEPGEFVTISVNDTGKGIAPELLDRIFEPFFTTKAIGKGTGLGLAMVFGFVKRSSGFVTVYSELDIGTSFRLYLPRAGAGLAVASTAATASKSLPLGGGTILVVDDEPELLELAKIWLDELGYQVLTATESADALAILAGPADIDLLFTDVVMPGQINGYQLAEQAMTMRPKLKMLLASGYSEGSIAKNGQAQFAADLLAKPYSRSDLAQRVSEALGRRQ